MTGIYRFKGVFGLLLILSILSASIMAGAGTGTNPETAIHSMGQAAASPENPVSQGYPDEEYDAGGIYVSDVSKLTKEHETTLASLINQFYTTGIDVWSVAEDNGYISPSGIDYNLRVSWEADVPVFVSYNSGQSARIKFLLNHSAEHPVSFRYRILSGSASRERLIEGTIQGEVLFEPGETEKVLEISISRLINNPNQFQIPSYPGEYWTGDRVFYIICSNIKNALFADETESITVPVPIQNPTDLRQVYQNASNTRLINLSDLSDVTSFPETPGKFLNSENKLKMGEIGIVGDTRTMIDTGVFSHITMPLGYFLNESGALGDVRFFVERDYGFGPMPANEKDISVEAQSQIDFDLGELQLMDIGLGPLVEANRLIQSLAFSFDYSSVTGAVYTCFLDQNGGFLQNQVLFSDQIHPFVVSAGIPDGTFHVGEEIPFAITYNEPIVTDNIRILFNGRELNPVERPGTISDTVSFLVGADGIYTGTLVITGATDLSGKTQQEVYEYALADDLVSFHARKMFSNLSETSVNIEQGDNIHSKGRITVSIHENTALSNWFSNRLHEGVLTAVKAKVIGQEGLPVDVLLSVNDGPVITELTGEFEAPTNWSGHNIRYMAEIYFDEAATGEFELVYRLSQEYVVPPIVLIDSIVDFDIVYTSWPAMDKIFANSTSPISLGYRVNVNATWQRSEDFLWSSSNEAVATILASGTVALTGEAGAVTFSLTATNGGHADPITITSKTLVVLEVQEPFLYIPAGVQNIEALKGDPVKVFFSTNITSRNNVYAGMGTVTAFTCDLYQAQYDGPELKKGSLVYQEIQNATAVNPILSCTIDSQNLLQTSPAGVYGYILEVSVTDLESGQTFVASANIRVRELPAKAVLVRPVKYYITDENRNLEVCFDIENRSDNTEILLTVMKNDEIVPIFSIESIGAAGVNHRVPINPVDGNRLLDVYTLSLKARNGSDEAWSYDSYILYVYNVNALKILVNGTQSDHLNLGLGNSLAGKTSAELMSIILNRQISLTGKVSINHKQYKWSNIADRIFWKMDGDQNISLQYNDGGVYRDIDDYSSPVFLPGSDFLIQGRKSGSSTITVTHASGMEATLQVLVDRIEDKLYYFQAYPRQKCQVSYTTGEGVYKSFETDAIGRLAVYEESGIKSDVVLRPQHMELYSEAILKNHQLLANQNSANDFGRYPHNNVILPLNSYKVTLDLYDGEMKEYFNRDVIVRGGVYRNGVYCPGATINGKSGSVDQLVSPDIYGYYILNFNPEEFKTYWNEQPIGPGDTIEYIIEIGFPEESHYTEIIKIDNHAIRSSRYATYGVFLKKNIRKLDSSKIQNQVTIISHTITIDGKEQPVPGQMYFESMPENATLNIELMLRGNPSDSYVVDIYDQYGLLWGWTTDGKTVKESYAFSNTVILRNTFNLNNLLRLMKQGETTSLYIRISAGIGSSRRMEIKLSEPFHIQNLIGIPKLDTLQGGGLQGVSNAIVGATQFPYRYDGDDGLVHRALQFLSDHSVDKSSMRLVIEPTDDPLVYKGIIKFAAGALTRENPSGVFSANENASESFGFMPGLSDVKEINKGSYVQKSKAQMNQNKAGSKGTYKTYGGGAYIECEIYYSTSGQEWRIRLLKSDVYVGAGGGYYHKYNTMVGPVPVTAEFRTGLTVQIGLKTFMEKVYYGDGEEDFRLTRGYITELRPYFYVYGFGGFGFDYEVVSLKFGPYGQISHDQTYLWYNGANGRRHGQKLTITGTTGVKFEANVAFVQYTQKYEFARLSRTWKYNDFDEINHLYATASAKLYLMGGEDGSVEVVLKPVGDAAAFENRAYLGAYDRQWMEPVYSMFSVLSAPSAADVTILQSNAYPGSNPVLTADGKMMAYLSDMDSTDINDTAVCFTTRESGEVFPKGSEIDPSSYPDSHVSIDGTLDGAVAAWVRVFGGLHKDAGEEADSEDVVDMLSRTEIMAGFYDGDHFTVTRLTTNNTPDMAPVVATNGEKAIVAWRSFFAGDIEDPLNFNGIDNILYAVFDGENWSEPRILYDGSIDRVNAVRVKMLSDGTTAITWQIRIKDTENTEVVCAVLDQNGEVVQYTRLTNNEIKDENPRITSVVFPDEVERFVIGWNSTKPAGDGNEENIIRLAAINRNGRVYPQFDKEIEETAGGSNYRSFQFTKGSGNIENLSIVWTEPDLTSAQGSEVYRDVLWGKKFIQEADGNIAISPKIKLVELDDNHVVDFFNATVDQEEKEIHFALLLSEHTGDISQAKLAFAKAGYQNSLTVEEVYFSYDDILPELDMPILFNLYNEGVEPISKVTVTLAGVLHEFDTENIMPGEYKAFTVLYPVPETIVNPVYSITAHFTTSMDTRNGALRMDVPDVGIYRISLTKEMERERSFRVLLRNHSHAKLKEGKHIVRLEVYDTPDFYHDPKVVKTISDAQSLGRMNEGMLPLDITLQEHALQEIVGNNGEIPADGAWIFFNVVIEEDGDIIEDADSSNDMDYIKIHSLLTKNGMPVSMASLMESEAGQTTVHTEVFNNSMNTITNGNILVILKDQSGSVIDIQQTYNPLVDGRGLVVAAGEEPYAKTFHFSKDGTHAEVFFSTVADHSSLLSVLKLNGVPLQFDPEVFLYNLQVTDLMETVITAIAENPESVVSITRNGIPVSNATPCALVYGTNTFIIRVRTGDVETEYMVIVQNRRSGSESINEPDNRNDNTAGKEGSRISSPYHAEMHIGGSMKRIALAISVDIGAGIAAVNLGEMAKEIFSGDENVVINIPPIPGINAYTLELPASTLAGSYGKASLTLVTAVGSICIRPGMLSGMEDLDGKTAGITIAAGDRTKLSDDLKHTIGGRPLIQLTFTLDGEKTKWRNPEVPAAVSIPYIPTDEELADPEHIVIWYIDSSGKAVPVPSGRYNQEASAVAFTTSHFSHFAVAFVYKTFGDLDSVGWARKPIEVLASKGIIKGISSTIFLPATRITRADYLLLLVRMLGLTAEFETNFDDVEPGSYYYEAAGIAKKLGITRGVGNNRLDPTGELSRQDMMVLTVRALERLQSMEPLKESTVLERFSDKDEAAGYAIESMARLVEAGLIYGFQDRIEPKRAASRAEAAAFLYRIYNRY